MVTIRIANMACGGCVKGVLATLAEAAPGAAAQVHLDRREVEVAADRAEPILVALRRSGWDAAQVDRAAAAVGNTMS